MFSYQAFDLNSVIYLRFQNNFISIFLFNQRKHSQGYEQLHIYPLSLIRNKSKQDKTLEMNSNQVVLFAHSPREIEIGCFKMRIFLSPFFIADKHTEMNVSRNILKLFFFFFCVSFSPGFLYFIVIDDSFSFPLVYLSIQYCAPVAFGT